MNSVNIEENCREFDNDKEYRSVCLYASDESDKASFEEFVSSKNYSEEYFCLCCMDESNRELGISTTYCSTPKKHKVQLYRNEDIQNEKGSDYVPEYADSQIFDISGEEAYTQIPDYANFNKIDETFQTEYFGIVPFKNLDLAEECLRVPVDDNVDIADKPKKVEKSVRVLRSRVIKY